MSLLIKSVLSIFFFSLSWGYALSTPIVNWKSVEDAVDEASPETCFILDVDDVITLKNDHIFHSENFNHFLEYMQSKSEKECMKIWGIVISTQKAHLVDPEVLNVLKRIQDKGLKAFALTLVGTGNRGKLADRENVRIEELKGFGIDFGLLSGYYGEWELEERGGQYGPPLFKDGVMFAAGFNKGTILFDTFDRIGYHPKHVVFIDDQDKNLKAVEEACEKRGCKCTTFHYRAVEAQGCPPLNDKIFKHQIAALEEGRWVSDVEAQKELDQARL